MNVLERTLMGYSPLPAARWKESVREREREYPVSVLSRATFLC